MNTSVSDWIHILDIQLEKESQAENGGLAELKDRN